MYTIKKIYKREEDYLCSRDKMGDWKFDIGVSGAITILTGNFCCFLKTSVKRSQSPLSSHTKAIISLKLIIFSIYFALLWDFTLICKEKKNTNQLLGYIKSMFD